MRVLILKYFFGLNIDCRKAQDAEGLVKEMDKKFEKYRRKIQKDSAHGQKHCKAFHKILAKPPWAAPDVPPTKIRAPCGREKPPPTNTKKKVSFLFLQGQYS